MIFGVIHVWGSMQSVRV